MIAPELRNNLAPGTRLVARYKGEQYEATFEVVDGKATYRLGDGRVFYSQSAAAGGVTGGSVNGWNFWSVAK